MHQNQIAAKRMAIALVVSGAVLVTNKIALRRQEAKRKKLASSKEEIEVLVTRLTQYNHQLEAQLETAKFWDIVTRDM